MGKLSSPETRTSRTSWRQKDMPGSNLQYERDFAGLNGETPDWIRGLRKEAFVGRISEGLRACPEAVRRHLGRVAAFGENPFTALNTAFLRDGILVYLPKIGRASC